MLYCDQPVEDPAQWVCKREECSGAVPIVNPFTHDAASSDDTHYYVDVAGMGSVCIHRSDDGIIVDIWPLHVVDAPVATAGADLSVLTEESDE